MFCKNCHTKDDEGSKTPPVLLMESKPLAINPNQGTLKLDKNQIKVLQAYNQVHVIEMFSSLSETEKLGLMKSLALIHFDFVDLMYHNMVLKASIGLSSKAQQVKKAWDEIRSEDILGDYSTREDFEATLKLVSEGKFSLVVCAGLSRKFGQDCAKIKVKPPWETDLSLIELVVRRAQEIGKIAIERFGKGYNKKRDPILIFIMINTKEIEEIKAYLQSVKNFGYKGLITFGQEVLPFITKDGRILLSGSNSAEISLVSNGSGAFISALKAQGLLESMKSNGVEVLQYINLNNLLVPLADSNLIKAALQKNFVVEVRKSDLDDQEIFPQVLFNKNTGVYEYLNQREVIDAMKEVTIRSSNYELKTLNIYFHIDLLIVASESVEQLCKYRIRGVNSSEKSIQSLGIMSNNDENTSKSAYGFELPVLNVLQLAKKVKFFVADNKWEAIALNSTEYSSINKYCIQEAVSRFFKNMMEIILQWVPLEYHEKLLKLSKKEKLHLFIISGYCFDERNLLNFMKSLPIR